jgi:2-polyprenyl-3-methyl-5-hydroxy-6-metoxy-1,4-benzoquinol methylase
MSMPRLLTPERMDDPKIDPLEHRQALRGLRRINRMSRSASVVWGAMLRRYRRTAGGRLSVLDVACGGGDLLIELAKRARRAGVSVEWSGCDVSPTALDHARSAASKAGVKIVFFPHDVIAEPLGKTYSFVSSTLFLHHLGRPDAVRLLENLRGAASEAVFVDDLVRSRRGYLLAWLGCRLLSRSPIVRFDGPASVRGAFTPAEARELAHEAGLHGVTVRTHWPCRYLMEWGVKG